MNPQNYRDLGLSESQRKIFDSHLWLVWRAVRRFGAYCSDIHFDDFKQHLRIELAKAVQLADAKHDPGAYLWLNVRDAARAFCFGRRRYGSAENRESAKHLSLDEQLETDEGERYTRMDRVERAWAAAEENDRSEMNQDHVAHLALNAMRHLDPRTRRVLKMRYVDGLTRDEVAERIGLSVVRVKEIQRSGVRLLRRVMAAEGYRALDERAPIPQ